MYIHIYIYMHIHINMHTYIHIYAYKYTHIYTYILSHYLFSYIFAQDKQQRRFPKQANFFFPSVRKSVFCIKIHHKQIIHLQPLLLEIQQRHFLLQNCFVVSISLTRLRYAFRCRDVSHLWLEPEAAETHRWETALHTFSAHV